MFTSFSFVFKMSNIAGDFYKNAQMVISTSVVLAGTLTRGLVSQMNGDVSGVFSMASLSMRRLAAGMQAISRRPRLLLATRGD